MAGSRRLAQLAGSIGRRAILPEGPWVVALSGGADSGALAWIAAERGALESCIHVHHGLDASDRLAEAARAIASAVEVPIVVERVEVGDGPSPENMARTARYAALAQAVEEGRRVLLGHTKNDQAETVLLNLVRGAGTSGLSGMPYHRPPNFYRPFLDVYRAECRELAALAEVPFVDDPTNQDRSIRRNRIRLDVLPLLEEMNPNTVDALARLAAHLGDDAQLLGAMADLRPIVDGERRSLSAGALITLPPSLRARTIRNIVAGIRREGLTTEELARIDAVVSGEVNATQIEGGIRVERQDAMVWFIPDSRSATET